jgi:pimeloyl-ACP methyl ester carboxylesterase
VETKLIQAVSAARPDWFDWATSVEPAAGRIDVAGARINFRVWGEPGRPGIVLVHGGAANAHWWDHVAPWLCAGRRVVALDLSGHGDSDHRDAYTRAQWADEVMAVADAAGFAGRPVIVGHSLGGFVTLEVAERHGGAPAGIVVIDSPVRGAAPESAARLRRRATAGLRTYPTLARIVLRFRPLPEDTDVPRWLSEYLAQRSVRAVHDGYRWQFDPKIFGAAGLTPDEVNRTACPVALLRGQWGFLTPGLSEQLAARTGPGTLQLTIPQAGHHIMLDQPLALTAVLDTLAASWLVAPHADNP